MRPDMPRSAEPIGARRSGVNRIPRAGRRLRVGDVQSYWNRFMVMIFAEMRTDPMDAVPRPPCASPNTQAPQQNVYVLPGVMIQLTSAPPSPSSKPGSFQRPSSPALTRRRNRLSWARLSRRVPPSSAGLSQPPPARPGPRTRLPGAGVGGGVPPAGGVISRPPWRGASPPKEPRETRTQWLVLRRDRPTAWPPRLGARDRPNPPWQSDQFAFWSA